MEMADGPAIYGCWIAIINLASRCDPRGTLLRSNGISHDIYSIARMTRMKIETVKKAIPILRDVLKWLEEIEENAVISEKTNTAHEGAGLSHLPAGLSHCPALNGMEGNGIEGNGKKKNLIVFSEGSVELELSKKLITLLEGNSPGFKKPDLNRWAKNIDLMIRVDKRDPIEIDIVMLWALNDNFWKSNVLSTGALRKHFDRLKIQMKERNGRNQPNCPKVSGDGDSRKYATV